MAVFGISSPAVKVAGVTYAIVPNSFTYTEGLGEQDVEVQASGKNVELVTFHDVKSNFSTVKFSMLSDAANIEAAKSWKIVGPVKIVVSGAQEGGPSFTRTFLNCILTNNYDVNLAVGGKLELEFKGEQAI